MHGNTLFSQGVCAMSETTINAKTGQLVPVTAEQKTLTVLEMVDRLQLETPDEQLAWFNALAGAGIKLDTMIGKTLNIKNALVTPHQWVDNVSGEVANGAMSFIQTVDDKVYVSASNGIAKSVGLLHYVFKTQPAPWKGGKKCLVKQIPLGKNRYYHLELVK